MNTFSLLPDEVIVHLCRYLDSYSLLKFGRSSSRMYNMVCTPEVWRRLLKGIEEFTDAKLRMLMFFANKGDSANLMTEVLREIATRNLFKEGEGVDRLQVTIGGWCDTPTTYFLTPRGNGLRKLVMVEEESGARMTLKEVTEFKNHLALKYIGDHLKFQESEVDYLEVGQFRGHLDNMQILRKSAKWQVGELCMADYFVHQLSMDQVKRHWRYLAKSAEGGHIKMLLMNVVLPIYEEVLDSVRKVWEISDNVKLKAEDKSITLVRGGWGRGDDNEGWEEFRQALQA